MTILEAMQDPELFGRTFKRSWLHGDTWQVWRSFLSALFALPLEAEQLALYRKHTARTDPPSSPPSEAFVIAGRRSGKSLIAALVAVYLACFRDYSGVLAPGELGVIMVLASDRRQARVVLGYINAFLEIPMLSRLVSARLKESVELTNRVRIEVHTSSFRSVRGYTVLAAVLDELAFWPTDDSANPDSEVLSALRPAMVTVPGAILLAISSPYARRGELWTNFREHFAKNDSPVLVWQAETRAMNPTVSRVVVETAYLRDAAAAAAEYGAQFRTDVEGFLALEVIESRIVGSRFELGPVAGLSYVAFCDPSGGQSDSMTLGIAHFERDLAVLDVLREVPAPFSPESAVKDFADVLKSYRLSEVTGDKYGAQWVKEQFEKRGVSYRSSDKTRSELYLELLPALMSGQIELLDNRKLVAQLCGLERRTGRGRDSIDHAPGAHDDVANAAAGALVEALRSAGGQYGVLRWFQQIVQGILTEDGLPKTPAPATSPATSPAISPATSPAVPGTCECGSTLFTFVSSQRRCQQCGAQTWAGANRTTSIGPTRGDLITPGVKGLADEFPISPSMQERAKTLSRFARR
jgi:hypothetical protein